MYILYTLYTFFCNSYVLMAGACIVGIFHYTLAMHYLHQFSVLIENQCIVVLALYTLLAPTIHCLKWAFFIVFYNFIIPDCPDDAFVGSPLDYPAVGDFCHCCYLLASLDG